MSRGNKQEHFFWLFDSPPHLPPLTVLDLKVGSHCIKMVEAKVEKYFLPEIKQLKTPLFAQESTAISAHTQMYLISKWEMVHFLYPEQ